jgi:hypothetical protein
VGYLTYVGSWKMQTKFWSGNVKGRDYLQEPRSMQKGGSTRMWIGFSWLNVILGPIKGWEFLDRMGGCAK